MNTVSLLETTRRWDKMYHPRQFAPSVHSYTCAELSMLHCSLYEHSKNELLLLPVVHYFLFYRNLAEKTQNQWAVHPCHRHPLLWMSHPCHRHPLLWEDVLLSTQPLKRLWSYPSQNMYCTPTPNLSKSKNNTLSWRRKVKRAAAKCRRTSDAGSTETPWPVWSQSWGQRGMENQTDIRQNQKLQLWQRE